MPSAQKDIGVEAARCFRVQMRPRIVATIVAGLGPVETEATTGIAAGNIVAEGFERLLDPGRRPAENSRSGEIGRDRRICDIDQVE
jgi:hypothetical protein